MNETTKKEIVLETLARINKSLDGDPNGMVTNSAGDVCPEAAYCELVQNILELIK